MLIEIGSMNRNPQHLPIGSLKLFGTNPHDEAIFRVVWSESRFYLCGAEHVEYDGDPANDATMQLRGKDPNVTKRKACYKWLPLYPSQKAWILEMWKSAIGFSGYNKEQWDLYTRDPVSKLLRLGPYPERGEYSQCFTFPSEPSITVVHNTINRIRAGWNYTYAEHLAANQEAVEKKEKDRKNRIGEIYMESQQAFKNRPTNIRTGKRTRKDIKIRYRAEDLGIKTRSFSTTT